MIRDKVTASQIYYRKTLKKNIEKANQFDLDILSKQGIKGGIFRERRHDLDQVILTLDGVIDKK